MKSLLLVLFKHHWLVGNKEKVSVADFNAHHNYAAKNCFALTCRSEQTSLRKTISHPVRTSIMNPRAQLSCDRLVTVPRGWRDICGRIYEDPFLELLNAEEQSNTEIREGFEAILSGLQIWHIHDTSTQVSNNTVSLKLGFWYW